MTPDEFAEGMLRYKARRNEERAVCTMLVVGLFAALCIVSILGRATINLVKGDGFTPWPSSQENLIEPTGTTR